LPLSSHQQGKAMTDHAIYVGADAAKSKIDIHAETLNLPRVITNDARGLTELVNACAGHHLICEATGSYHHALRDACFAANLTLSVINPARVRDFARSEGRLAKTDRLDVLAKFGREKRPDPARQTSAPTTATRSPLSQAWRLLTATAARPAPPLNITLSLLPKKIKKHSCFWDAVLGCRLALEDSRLREK
jgi:transposase